jgi:hypothetical protein
MSGCVSAMCGGGGPLGVFNASLPLNSSFAGSNDYQIKNDGTYVSAGAAPSSGNWINPANATVAAFYQVKTVVSSGSFTSDPSAGVYIDCATSRNWQKSVAGTVNFTMTFREKGTLIVRATYSMSLTVT